ncbi:hypothetical protein HDU98_000831 [Podochytrium sp. JEL0797]|nr:hypothetical protein HDU98_000831 [Podochytrium sp. JEL0797]
MGKKSKPAVVPAPPATPVAPTVSAAPHLWIDAQVIFLLRSMLTHAEQGKRSQSGFKAEAWTAVLRLINETFTVNLTSLQIKNKIQVEKLKFKVCFAMKAQSGFSFDHDRGQPSGDSDAMEAYIDGLPKGERPIARKLVEQGLPNYALLHDLFHEHIATGKLARGSQPLGPRSESGLEKSQQDSDSDDTADEDENSLPQLPPSLTVSTPLGTSSRTNLTSATPTPAGSSKKRSSAQNGERGPRSHKKCLHFCQD